MTQDPTTQQFDTQGAKGITAARVRDHNERLVLSLIKRNGQMPSAEIARQTSLSAQTASVITRSLELDGLLKRAAPQKGKVGKPIVPLHLNPDGAFAYGLRIGRRGADLILMDLTGETRGHQTVSYPYPTPDVIENFVKDGITNLGQTLSPDHQARIVGIGIGAPFQLWNWLDTVNAPKSQMSTWKDYSFKDAFAAFTPLPVQIINDGTIACAAERAFGASARFNSHAYFFVGSFVGGGLVIDDKIHFGPSGNAAAFGSIPVGTGSDSRQLINNASIYVLEHMVRTRLGKAVDLWGKPEDWDQCADCLPDWIEMTAVSLARAATAITAVLDITEFVIDGGMPDAIRAELVAAINTHLAQQDTRGIRSATAHEGSLGRKAGALGAAYQPILSAYLS